MRNVAWSPLFNARSLPEFTAVGEKQTFSVKADVPRLRICERCIRPLRIRRFYKRDVKRNREEKLTYVKISYLDFITDGARIYGRYRCHFGVLRGHLQPGIWVTAITETDPERVGKAKYRLGRV